MRKVWILLFLTIISINILNAMQIILYNDRVITGKFIEIKEENVIIFSYEKLVTVSLYTIVTIFDNKKNEISKDDLINLEKGRLNYNSVKEEISITPTNIARNSLIFPGKSNFAEIYLIDDSSYSGSIEGNDERSILIYDSKENSYSLIMHKDIKKIVHNSLDITEETLSYVNGIDFYLVESYEVINQQKHGILVDEYSESTKKKTYSFTAGCDFGFSHIIKRKEKEYRYDLEPSGYAKFEILNKNNSAGFGIGLQIYKKIKYSRDAICTFIPIYFILPYQTDLIGLEVNLGTNLFLGNHNYNPDEEYLLPGFYIAIGPTFAVSNDLFIELLYTLNNGNTKYVSVFNQSFSIGFTLR